MAAMNFIDTQIHGSSYPATYVAPGTLQWFGVSATQGSTSGTLPASPPSGAYGSNTYTMLVGNPLGNQSTGSVAGYFTSNNNLTVIPVGFVPTRIKIWNDTDGIEWEWMYGMAATHTIKTNTTGPAITNDTSSAIVVYADSAGGQGDVAYVQLSAALCGNSKRIAFRIEV